MSLTWNRENKTMVPSSQGQTFKNKQVLYIMQKLKTALLNYSINSKLL